MDGENDSIINQNKNWFLLYNFKSYVNQMSFVKSKEQNFAKILKRGGVSKSHFPKAEQWFVNFVHDNYILTLNFLLKITS